MPRITVSKRKILTSSDDPHELWQNRMQREGKWKAIYQRIQEVKKETGEKGFATIVHRIGPEHDFRGAAEERVLFSEYLDLELSLQEGDPRAQSVFELIVNRMRLKAPAKIENTWISSHPAMRRRDRVPGNKKIILSISDILDSPSQSAINKLQYWCNEPKEFFKSQQLAEKPPPPKPVPAKESSAEKKVIDEPALGEVKTIIDEFFDGIKGND